MMMMPPALTPLLTFSPRAIVWLWLRGIPLALTFVLIFIPVLFDVDGEWRRLVPSLEAGVYRSLIQARKGRRITHSRKKFRLKVIGSAPLEKMRAADERAGCVGSRSSAAVSFLVEALTN